jgi:uncharacterized membrane protein
MITEKFRRQLRQEAAQWQTEGLINEDFYEQLAARYQFGSIETNAQNRFTNILLSIGGLLLGLGVITFVAANWQDWGREVRILLLLSVFITVNTIGFRLWQRGRTPWQSLLGQALLFTGALTLGANMALMAQMFHIGGAEFKLYLVWGVGVLLMAYSLRLTILGVLAIALIGIGYWTGFSQAASEENSLWLWVFTQMPILSAAAYLSLAYWCRSKWIFTLGMIAVMSALLNLISSYSWFAYWGNWQQGIWGLVSLILPPAFLWSFHDFPWRRSEEEPEVFASIARKLGIFFIIYSSFFLSFYSSWSSSQTDIYEYGGNELSFFSLPIGLFTIWTIYNWVRLAQLQTTPPYLRLDLNNSVILGILGTMAIVSFWHGNISNIPVLGTFIFNLLLFILGAGLTKEGLTKGDRLSFWMGMILLTGQIFSRTFEYETGLLLKSLVLILCGIGVMVAGVWFERYRHHQSVLAPN